MGGKGGPLAFLNKKGWHPGNQRNQERVWKKEQAAAAEQKQVEELRKQYEEARQKEEVESMAVAAGVKKKQERLDWMYQGGIVAKQEAEKRADAQMMGERPLELPAEEAQPDKVEQVSQLPTFYASDTPASANEMWQRLHGDPMFVIKQQELSARKKVVSNPVQMDNIRRTMLAKEKAKAARKAEKKAAKEAKRAAKKAKKDKKEKKRRKDASSDSESSDDDADEQPAKRPRADPEAHIRSRQESNGKASYEGPSHRSHREGNGEYHERHHHGHNGESRHRSSLRSEPREGQRPDRHDRERHAREDRHKDRDHRRENGRDSDGARGDRGFPWESQARGDNRESRREVHVHHDSASAQGRDLTYGLNRASAQDLEDREARRRETERRLEEARVKKEAEAREKAAQRYQRKEHKTGQLSEEEKQRRLAEMSGNADVHEEARWARLQAAIKYDDSQEELERKLREKAAAAHKTPGTHHQDTAKFLSKATKDAYGGEDASLADRVTRRKYFNDRTRDDTAGAFQR